MTLVVENAWTDTQSSGSTFTFDTLAEPAEGNLLIAATVATNNYLAQLTTATGGWTRIIGGHVNYARVAVFWKIAGAGEGTSFPDFHDYPAFNQGWSGSMLEISGFDPTNPIDDFDFTAGYATSAVAPSVGQNNDNELIISGHGLYGYPSVSQDVDNALVKQTDINETSAYPSSSLTGTEIKTVAGAGPPYPTGTYTHTWLAATNKYYLSFTLAIGNGETIIAADSLPLTFDAKNVTVTSDGIIAAKSMALTFTEYKPTVENPRTIPADSLALTFAAKDADITFSPIVQAESLALTFKPQKASVDGFYVGQVVPGIWPNEIEPTGSIGDST